MGGDDDGAGVENWAEDFHYGVTNNFEGRLLRAGREAEMADDVLDDEEGAIPDHAEIEGAEGKQIRGNFVEVEANGGEEEGERNGEGEDERAAGISQKEK